MKLKKKKAFPILIIVFLSIIYSCANIVSPTGGPKDEEPPVVLRSVPENYSTHYQGQNVRIFFDEYVTLKNLMQNLLISPPLNEDPEIRIRGKSVMMSISDTLLPNTTYNFFFGDAIVDITEGNAIPNFQFVVSTGDYVDSLSFMGSLVDAFTLMPEENVFVMMYDNVNPFDSIPLLKRPVYLTKTDKEGRFRINNIKEGQYLVFALKDLNSNYIYDNPEEKIAFLDSLVTPIYHAVISPEIDSLSNNRADSLLNDSLSRDLNTITPISDPMVWVDPLKIDTLALFQSPSLPFYELFLFPEKDTVQRVVSSSFLDNNRINMVFRIPYDTVSIREFENPFNEDWFIPEYSSKRDTLTLWLPSIARDTLRLEVTDRGNIVDSVIVSLVKRPDRSRLGARTTTPSDPVLGITAPSLVSRTTLPYFEYFQLHSATPLVSFESQRFELFLNDTVPVEMDYQFYGDVNRTIKMTQKLEPDSSYLLFIPPGAITDLYGVSNDTLKYSFKLNNESLYGSLILSIQLPDNEIVADYLEGDTTQDLDEGEELFIEEVMEQDTLENKEPYKSKDKQYILQLTNDKLDEVIAEKVITQSGTYTFINLPAKSFTFRLIEDANNNGVWDTGNYLRQLQPERVWVYPDKVETRLNWEIEAIWEVE
jgi:hypothetical protein